MSKRRAKKLAKQSTSKEGWHHFIVDVWLTDLNPTENRLLASIPNCHFGPEDILRRPLRRDDPRHDRSLVHKDLRYLTRELYRSGFETVESFGTYDAFLLARR